MFPNFDPRVRFREIILSAAVVSVTTSVDVDQRVPAFIGQEGSAATTFARRKAVVVGLGSVGRRIALHLARLGIEVMWLVDHDRFDSPANLLTQEILPEDLNKGKAASASKACKAISPRTQIFYYEGKLQNLDPVLMAEADVVFLATDNLVAEIEVATRFRLLGIPIIQGSVHGESLVAQVRFIGNRPDDPCLVCGFGPEEWRYMNQSSVFTCSGPDGRSNEQVTVMPTMSTSFLCSTTASLALTQWTRHTLALGAPVVNSILQHCGFNNRMTQAPLILNDECRSNHTVLRRSAAPPPMSRCTLRQLAELAGYRGENVFSVSFTLGEKAYVESAICGCTERSVGKFVADGGSVGRCVVCDKRIMPQPFYTHRPTPARIVQSQLDRSLKELGAASPQWAVVHSRDRGVLLT